MPAARKKSASSRTSLCRPVDLSKRFDWPRRVPKSDWWQDTAKRVREMPRGRQTSWGIPFRMASGAGPNVLVLDRDRPAVTIPVKGKASYLCFLHDWHQHPSTLRQNDPTEGLVVAEYCIDYADGSSHVQPIRARFEVGMAESPGPAWLAMPFNMPVTVDPAARAGDKAWGHMQPGLDRGGGRPLVYAMPNPHPKREVVSVTLRGLQESPLFVAALTAYAGKANPLRHLPRRAYRVAGSGKPRRVREASVDLGVVARTEVTSGVTRGAWLAAEHAGTGTREPDRAPEDILQIVAAEDATLRVQLHGARKPVELSVGDAFRKGRSRCGDVRLEVLGSVRQWMQVTVVDGATGRPTPVRVHFEGTRGEYIAPYGHHEQVNANWFEDYGADVVFGGRNYAYVSGEFTTDMPVGDVYVEINKGYEYQPVRKKVTIQRGQKQLELRIDRWKDLRREGWVTADTHVHFLSPQTAWLESQCEGINVANLLASQWGRLFTNVGDIAGKPNVVQDDTIVFVGTENRNHMLGHMSMLGTQGLPVYPMCAGGPSESWVGDPDFVTLAEWARENKRKGGVVIRPHYPYCGHTEDPVPIIKGLVDALEIGPSRRNQFPLQEWYRYLNCGYRVAVAGGTDKMGAYTALGWVRTYAKLDPNVPFTYDAWAEAMRAGRTVTTNGPMLSLEVDGRQIGDTIDMASGGGTVEVRAVAECFCPLERLEIVCGGEVVAEERASKGVKVLAFAGPVKVSGSSWLAARCWGKEGHPGSYMGAHTSPVYVRCGDKRPFNGPAAEHMLALVEGGMEYLNTLATNFDESSRRRMVGMFKEVQAELKGRLVVEAQHVHHHGDGHYHTHGHGVEAGHRH